MANDKCKYCNTSFFKIITKEQTLVINGVRQTSSWVGCQKCWDLLQIIG